MDDQVLRDLLTAKQAGEILGINPVTVTRWALAGHLKFITVPPYDKRMYRREDVETLAAQRRQAAQ